VPGRRPHIPLADAQLASAHIALRHRAQEVGFLASFIAGSIRWARCRCRYHVGGRCRAAGTHHRRCGCRWRFIPHEFGHDTLKLGIQKRIPKYVGRAKVLHHLQKASQANPGFDWTAIATGYTLDVGIISGDLGLDLEWHSATLHGFGDECFAASSLERVGKVVASVIQRWNDVKNHYLYAAGVITCANEIIRSAESVTDCEWTVGTGDIEDCIREGESRIAKGYPDAGMCLLERSVLYDDELDASAPFQSQESNEVLHLSPESVHTIVENAYHDFRNHGKPGCGCSS
jgi:hypothetical protein